MYILDNGVYLGCFMNADDLILVSASVMDLQKMLNVCESIGSILGINFNSTKSKCIIIGPL